MKKILLVAISVFLCTFLRAQSAGTIMQNSWAGGICCTTGVDYTFSLEFPQGTFTCFDSLQVDFDGSKYLFSDMDLVRSNRADLSVGFTVSFGYQTNNKGYDLEGGIYYHDITGAQIQTVAQGPPRFILVRNGLQEFITNITVESTITAYP